MSKNLVGFVTFGNVEFSKLTYKSIKDTTKNPIDFFIVIGKPGDAETADWAREEGIPFIAHDSNKGFPASINDIYDYAWKQNNYDNLVITGNDVVFYPYCIDSLINVANEGHYHVISALQYDVRSLLYEHPEARDYFKGENCIFTDFESTPWNKFESYYEQLMIADMQLYDIQNCCLYTKTYFETVGYIDVSFYPAYFCDNDLALRIVKSGINCCTLTNARFFHFWSRTIKQGSGGSSNKAFELNRLYYIHKWGGNVGSELYSEPFDGEEHEFTYNLKISMGINIQSRDQEDKIINFWRSKL